MQSNDDLLRESRKVSRLLVVLVIVGSVLRFWAVLHTSEWKLSSVHSAWQLFLDEAVQSGLHFDQLVNYPHELGGMLLSLIALSLAPLRDGLPTLAISAVLVDSLARLVQLRIAYRLYGQEVAIWFGTWTIAATPASILWSGLGSTLYSFSAVFPFVLMWLGTQPFPSWRQPGWLLLAACTGLGIVWSYSTLVFAPVAFIMIWCLTQEGKRGAALTKYAVTVGIVSLLLACPFGSIGDGYALESHSPFWTQLKSTEVLSPATWSSKFRMSWTHSFPGASVLPALGGLSLDRTRLIWGSMLYVGLALALLNNKWRVQTLIGIGCILAFMIAYPFYAFWTGIRDRADHNAFLFYRHTPIILPTVILISLTGFFRLRLSKWVLGSALIAAGLFPVLSLVTTPHEAHEIATRPQGWAAGRKLGHNPERIGKLVGLIGPKRQDEFLAGVGWGIAGAVRRNSGPGREAPMQLARIVLQYPSVYRRKLIEGIDYALETEGSGTASQLKLSFHQELSNFGARGQAGPD